MLLLSSFSFVSSLRSQPTAWCHPSFGRGLLTSIKCLRKRPCTDIQRCVYRVAPNRVKLVMMLNHSRRKARTLNAIARPLVFHTVLSVPGRLTIFFSQHPSEFRSILVNDQFFSRKVKISPGNTRTLQKEACIEWSCMSIAYWWESSARSL